MTTLSDCAPIDRLAAILHAAMAAGPGLWNGGADRSDRESGPYQPSEFSRDLLKLFTRLNAANAPYLLVGGVAMLRYIEGRNTDDVDLIIAMDAARRIKGLVLEEQDADAARARFGSLRVDLLLTSNPVFELAQRKFATTHRFAEITVPCATVEGLVLLKLYALPSLYRQSHLQRAALYETDITMLCERHNPAIEPLLMALKRFVGPGEFEELKRIAGEIELRVERMKRRADQP